MNFAARGNGPLRRWVFLSGRALGSVRPSSSLSERFHQELTTRRLPLIYDYLSPQPSHLLNLSLVGYVPELAPETSLGDAGGILPLISSPSRMAVGHHLVYFPPQVTLSQLLPDGTDVLHTPGEPFNRRMWAGGRVRFPQQGGPLLDGRRAVCIEGIRDVKVKGLDGQEKIFVSIERRVATVGEQETEEEIRSRVWQASEEDFGDAEIIERRDLVFLREKTPEQLQNDKASFSKGGRIVKPPSDPELSFKLRPNKALLFRYSALTFNAHSIHLDKSYAQDVEGYRNLLVHGPLSLTLLLTVLRCHLYKLGRVIRDIEYRNLAPLYVCEEMTICAKPKRGLDTNQWEVWIAGEDGGLTVRGTVHTSEL
ncbi:hypothetical protein DTO164E3_2204 [Paecilomyces variotii]|nr:hypothetical protein DTO032I3_6055 [Paecilomyces variotii]KAJ9203850.1 hypothetical protein DTO164E3_2204 [Paecilomyces variotii]KAJ9225756.1 hypothetical protein DTO169C6_1819 [Paecilomyces variotii]KAJ9252773.1 hypothetical protein DTO207G8_4559 [Paecilomyces variotii]KAJ9276503.1 hypothetical protein DTO021D3_6570 [Paecilomyces variotii]